MKVYTGSSNPQECEYIVLKSEDTSLKCEELNPRLDLRNHSPTGLSWGYAGSGPAQCALAILADCVGDELALKHYQRFKHEVVAGLGQEFKLTEDQIRSWLKEQTNEA